jgi:[acyl-carrier-protein] S-malonyltransferase
VFPVYSNVEAAPAVDIASSLGAQLTHPVRFAESIEAMLAAGVDTFVHVGPGDVTVGLVKRTSRDAATHVVATLEQASLVASELSVQ